MKALCVAAILAISGCATESTTTRTYGSPYVQGPTGQVTQVREVVHRVHGNPGAGAVAGALVGGLLFHGSGPSTLFGAAAGAGIGAAASSGSAESRQYEIDVRFDNGQWATYIYNDYSPFRPGDRVIVDGRQLRPY